MHWELVPDFTSVTTLTKRCVLHAFDVVLTSRQFAIGLFMFSSDTNQTVKSVVCNHLRRPTAAGGGVNWAVFTAYRELVRYCTKMSLLWSTKIFVHVYTYTSPTLCIITAPIYKKNWLVSWHFTANSYYLTNTSITIIPWARTLSRQDGYKQDYL